MLGKLSFWISTKDQDKVTGQLGAGVGGENVAALSLVLGLS